MQGDLLANVPRLFCFVSGAMPDGKGNAVFQAIAVGSHGRFVGGSCGRTHAECWAALRKMEKTFRGLRWTQPFEMLWVNLNDCGDPNVRAALAATRDALARQRRDLEALGLWTPDMEPAPRVAVDVPPEPAEPEADAEAEPKQLALGGAP